VQPVTRAIADSFDLKEPKGALVASVDAGGPADKSGVQPGDVILSFNGKTIDQSSDLPRLVSEVSPGQKAAVKVLREGKERDINVTIGEFKNENVAENDTEEPAVKQGRLGVAARALTAEEQRESGVKSGVVVERAQGAAAAAGIQQGDIIVRVNGVKVENAQQLRDAVSKAKKSVALLIQRDKQQLYVPVDLG
jgi:serine protease Do